jgi:hypothetical protein
VRRTAASEPEEAAPQRVVREVRARSLDEQLRVIAQRIGAKGDVAVSCAREANAALLRCVGDAGEEYAADRRGRRDCIELGVHVERRVEIGSAELGVLGRHCRGA